MLLLIEETYPSDINFNPLLYNPFRYNLMESYR
jgi:hypothetical protein